MINFYFSSKETTFSFSSWVMTLILCSLLWSCSEKRSDQKNELTPSKNYQENIDKNSLDIWPVLTMAVKKDQKIEAKIVTILASMTLEQKVAQMIQPEIRDITVEDMRKYGFGSYLNGGGAFPNNDKHATPEDWITLAEDFYQASVDSSLDGSSIPTIWGTDAVHGHNNVIGATLFPHNIGLGATGNPKLIEKIAAITATEVMVTGIDWVFAPTVAVVRDDRWGRTYEGYSEDPEIVRLYSAAIVKGLQGHADKDFLGDQRVISTVKHFLGDGGTEQGDDQGDNIDSEQTLFDIHGQGYVGGLSAGAQSVMASFNSWQGNKIHGNQYLLTDVLKNKMGFDGFVVGDWNGHGQIAGCTNESCPQSINAGLDIFMVPTDAWKPLYENTIAQVKRNEIPLSRIDDAVSRILRVKLRAGIFDKPSPAKRIFSGKTELIGAQAHRDVARQAVRESLVLLKNKGGILPLSPEQQILIAGDGADNIGKQSGGWTITWQGTGNSNSDFPGGTSIYQGINEIVEKSGGKAVLSIDGSYIDKPDVAIVVFGEEPYAEGHGDRDNLEYQRGDKKDLALLKKLKSEGIPVVAIFISGRPMWVNAELNASDAFVAAWLPGSEGAGVAEVLFKDANENIEYDFTGKLSYSWLSSLDQISLNRGDENYEPLFPYGYGLTYQDIDTLPDTLSERAASLAKSTQHHIFNGMVNKPWLLSIYSGNKTVFINSNVIEQGSIKFRTIDKTVQEDAIQITFDGKKMAGINFQSDFTEDLRSLFEVSGQLSFDYQVIKAPTSAVKLAMHCDKGCKSELDITKTLVQSELNNWQTMRIDLSCFNTPDFLTKQVTDIFNLSTHGQLQISFSNINISASIANTATDFECDGSIDEVFK